MHAIARFGALLLISTFLGGGSVAGHPPSPLTSEPALAAKLQPAVDPLDQYGGMPYLPPAISPMPVSVVPYGAVAPIIAQAATTVRISNFSFSPSAITVMAGQTVTWTNADSVPHTTTSDTGMWDSGVLAPGASYSVTFNTPGTFAYRCMIHPFMMGTVTVLPSTAASSGVTVSPASAAPPAGLSVSYAAGWNLVAGPAGTTVAGTNGPLYTFRAGDTTYETVPATQPLAAGVGYWAYFGGPMTEMLPRTTAAPLAIPLPAGQFVLVGNPATTPVTLAGADVVLGYSANAGYQPTAVLQPGQGAWAFSRSGATVTMQP